MIDEKLTIEEIAKEFKVSTKTVTRWFDRGLPFLKIGRVKRILRSDLDQYTGEGKHNVRGYK